MPRKPVMWRLRRRVVFIGQVLEFLRHAHAAADHLCGLQVLTRSDAYAMSPLVKPCVSPGSAESIFPLIPFDIDDVFAVFSEMNLVQAVGGGDPQ